MDTSTSLPAMTRAASRPRTETTIEAATSKAWAMANAAVRSMSATKGMTMATYTFPVTADRSGSVRSNCEPPAAAPQAARSAALRNPQAARSAAAVRRAGAARMSSPRHAWRRQTQVEMPTTADATGTPARASRDTAVDGEYTARVTATRASSKASSAAQIRQGRTGASARTAPRGPGPTAAAGISGETAAEPGTGAADGSDAAVGPASGPVARLAVTGPPGRGAGPSPEARSSAPAPDPVRRKRRWRRSGRRTIRSPPRPVVAMTRASASPVTTTWKSSPGHRG